MKREFVQVRPNNGFLIHAVPADTKCVGFKGWFSAVRPICGKIRNMNAQRFYSLPFLSHKGAQVPFTADTLRTADKAICIKCATRVAQATE